VTAAEAIKKARERREQANSLPCLFGTPHLDHYDPPIGTGKGCKACENYQGEDLR